MQLFLTRHASEVKGTLSGFDRVRFRGTLRWLASVDGLGTFLHRQGVLLKEFKVYAQGLTERIKRSAQQLAARAQRPLQYLYSSSLRKEDVAHDIAERDGVTDGLVCVVTAVEPCLTLTVGPNRDRRSGVGPIDRRSTHSTSRKQCLVLHPTTPMQPSASAIAQWQERDQ